MSVLYWLPVLVLAGIVLNGLRLRGRVRRLHRLEPDTAPVQIAHRFVTAEGVDLDDATRRAASAYAEREGLEVLDLVPGDLSCGRALDLARMIAPESFRAKRLAPGRGAFHALLVDTGVLERAGVRRLDGLDPVQMAELTVRLKRYACTSTDFAVAPDFRARTEDVGKRLALLKALYASGAQLVLALPALLFAALVAGIVANPVWGAAAAVAFCAQPLLVFAGGPIAPRRLPVSALLRLVLAPARWVRTVTGRWRPAPATEDPGKAAWYAARTADGVEGLLEPRREDCPLCASTQLSVRLRTPDLVQRKPGWFTLEQCAGCGHTFQNPRLSLAGLDFYYRDFYDGLGEEQMESVFGAGGDGYAKRAEMLRPHTSPKRWLDVGAGHGHFCNLARDLWPDTTFDGLDMSESIGEAERRRWVDVSYRGMFPELADQLVGLYDVVSMFHYLEHTREPLEELDAARQVLRAGGYLLIELPNPESRFGRLLGKYWLPWFQPQHQHLFPIGNLERALSARGFRPVSVERGPAHIPVDFSGALALALNRLLPDCDQPWLTASRSRRIARASAFTAAIPLFALALGLDQVMRRVLRGGNGGNAYRVLSVRTED